MVCTYFKCQWQGLKEKGTQENGILWFQRCPRVVKSCSEDCEIISATISTAVFVFCCFYLKTINTLPSHCLAPALRHISSQIQPPPPRDSPWDSGLQEHLLQCLLCLAFSLASPSSSCFRPRPIPSAEQAGLRERGSGTVLCSYTQPPPNLSGGELGLHSDVIPHRLGITQHSWWKSDSEFNILICCCCCSYDI